MSGLAREETVLQEGAIRKQIGRGITAGLLRNICYNIHTNSQEDWETLVNWMEKLFYIQLDAPKRSANDDLVLEYSFSNAKLKTEKPLDIMQAGRGQLQMLLLIAFVLWRKNSIVLIDEPDAHLEVLRQSQVMEVLKTLTDKYDNQVIIATHSEVIMNEADNLTFLLNGKRILLDENRKKAMKSSLKEFGIEHYYKAELTKSVLYLEGTTDKQNLIAVSELLGHKLAHALADKVFIYYTQSPDTQHKDFEMQAGYYSTHKKHFSALFSIVSNLKGIALFDNDNKNGQDEDAPNGLKIRFWKQYEFENYFITPESVAAFVENYFIDLEGSMFAPVWTNKFNTIFEKHFLAEIFDNNNVLLNLYKSGSSEEKDALYISNSKNKKVSALLEKVFEAFYLTEKVRILKKGEFYQIARFCEPNRIDSEVIDIFDEIYETIRTLS